MGIDRTGYGHCVAFHMHFTNFRSVLLPKLLRQLSNTDAAYHFLEWAEHYELWGILGKTAVNHRPVTKIHTKWGFHTIEVLLVNIQFR